MAAGLTFALDVASAWEALSVLRTDTRLLLEVPWHPAALRPPLRNGPFPRWVTPLPLRGEQGRWQKSGAVVCRVLCADLHCTVLACCWAPCCGHNVLTNPQCTWVGAGCVFQQATLGVRAGWKLLWRGSSSCHLDAPLCSAESNYPNSLFVAFRSPLCWFWC